MSIKRGIDFINWERNKFLGIFLFVIILVFLSSIVFATTIIHNSSENWAGTFNQTIILGNNLTLNWTNQPTNTTYALSGTYISQIINAGSGSFQWDNLSWSETTGNITRIYDFSDLTDKTAFEKNGTIPSNPFDYKNEATSENYTNIATSDNSRWITSGANSTNQYDSQIFIFNITEDVSKIQKINITWEGYGETATGYYTNMSIFNWTSNLWYWLDNKDFTSAVDSSLNSAITSDLSNFVNSTTNQIAVLITTKKALSQGETCSLNTSCSSGLCIDGYCCNNACSDTCKSCSVAGSLGNCTFVPDGQQDSVVTPCVTCDGAGNLENVSINTQMTGCNAVTTPYSEYCDGTGDCMKVGWINITAIICGRWIDGVTTTYCKPSTLGHEGYGSASSAPGWVFPSSSGVVTDSVPHDTWCMSTFRCVEKSSSPYIYVYDGKKYNYLSDFIPNAKSKEKENTFFTDVSQSKIINNKLKLKITEELDEISYINDYYLEIFDYRNESEFNDYFWKNFEQIDNYNFEQIGFEKPKKIIGYNIKEKNNDKLILNSDDIYLVMEKGFEKELEFNIPKLKENYNRKIFFVAEGYYIKQLPVSEEITNENAISQFQQYISFVKNLFNKNEKIDGETNPHNSLYTDYIKMEISSSSNIKFQVQSCNDASCSGETFVGPSNTSLTYFTSSPITLNTTITPENPYFQYKTFFYGNISITPYLHNVTFSYTDNTPATPVTPPSGGGSSGGGSAVVVQDPFEINKDLFHVVIKQGETKRETLIITNLLNKNITIKINSSEFQDFLIISEDTFTLIQGESKTINIDFFSKEKENADSYTGRIVVSGGGKQKIINTIVEIKEKLPLFDLRVDIQNKKIVPGNELKFKLLTINQGDLTGFDILVYYSIRDFEGNVYEFKEESIKIDKELEIDRGLIVPTNLTLGKYILSSKITYSNVTATAIDTFEALSEKGLWMYKLFVGGIVLAIIIVSGLLFWVLNRKN